ncbi:hypothetical protein AJ80_00194 [Polytolypa hystricis UAMH7299]|uniref:Uncharacterized protein n=1 Tax=Polytolypa hystricis (strain UAMH7299) TaxID=1447883 RepID=A0A2B7Z3F5_POLH7|nr:hypothetical protein AJ80_00194 [Polytolypa hystricis UAMH7299]
MSWQQFPPEVRLLILQEAIKPNGALWWQPTSRSFYPERWIVWRGYIQNYLFVSKEWNKDVRDRLETVPTDLVIRYLSESLSLDVLERNIRKIKRKACSIRPRESHPEGLIAETLGNWLFCSVVRGYISCAKLLLNAGVDVNYRRQESFSSLSSLLSAYYSRHWEMVELLISYGADISDQVALPNGHCRVGYAILCEAAERDNNMSLVQSILDRGIPVQESSLLLNPLFKALDANCVDMALLLLDNGASFLNTETTAWLPLGAAARACSVETVSMLIGKGADVNSRIFNYEGPPDTPLSWAISRNEPVARLLIERGAEITEVHIQAAVTDASFSLLQALIDKAGHWASIFALDQAAVGGRAEYVRALLDQGVKPRGLNIDVVRHGNKEIMQLLLDAGADPNTRSDSGTVALGLAVLKGSVGLVELLLNAKVPVEFHPDMCSRMLHAACVLRMEDMVRFLLKRGAQAHHGNAAAFTKAVRAAPQSSSRPYHEDIAELLLQYETVKAV